MAKKSSSGGSGRLFLGFIIGILAVAATVFLYFRFGNPAVAVADAPFPFERQLTHIPLNARIDRELKTPPFGTSEDVFEGGAHIYMTQCASCHGTPGHDVDYARFMYPHAPQLWKKHARGNVTGVSDDEPGETYWKIANGIRLSGMPAYKQILSETQMWQVTMLLKNASTPLPDPVIRILTAPRQ